MAIGDCYRRAISATRTANGNNGDTNNDVYIAQGRRILISVAGLLM